MAYTVEFAPEALAQLSELYRYIATTTSPHTAPYREALKIIRGITNDLRGCPFSSPAFEYSKAMTEPFTIGYDDDSCSFISIIFHAKK